MRRGVLLSGLLLVLLSCAREETSFLSEGIRFAVVGADAADTKTIYEGTEDPVQHKERIDWISGDVVRIWSDRARAGLPPQDHADYKVITAAPDGLRSVAEISPVVDPLNWKSGAHHFYGLYPSPVMEDMDAYISVAPNVYDEYEMTCRMPQGQSLTWTDDGDLHRSSPDMRFAYLWAYQSASEPTHDVQEMAFQPRFTAFEFVFTSSKIPAIHLRSFTLETTDDTPLFGTFTIKADGSVANITATTSSVTYSLDQIIHKDKYLSITVLALYKDISNLKITVTGDEILTRSLKLEQVNGTALAFPAGKKYRFVNLDFPAVYAEGEGILWNQRVQILGVGEELDWRALQDIIANGSDVDRNITEDTGATSGEDMQDPGVEDPGADGQDMLADNSSQMLTARFTDTPAIAFNWNAADKIAIHYNIPEASFSTYFSSTLSSGAGRTDATFKVSKSGVRNGYALYPGSMAIDDASGTDGLPLRVALQQAWNVDECPLPIPMAAVNTEGADLDFKAMCGEIRLSLTGIPEGTRYLTVTTDKAVYGEFNVDVSGSTPVLSGAVDPASGNMLRLDFAAPVPSGGVSKVLDIPVPDGDYAMLIVKAFNGNKILGISTRYATATVSRAAVTAVSMEMSGPGSLADFTLAQDVSYMAGQDTEELGYTISQILSGGGTGAADGYTLAVESNTDAAVASISVSGNVINLTPLAVGTTVLTMTASKGGVTLKSSTTITVKNISGIGFRASYPYVPLRNSHVEEAFPVVGSAEVSGSNFNYQWSVVSGSGLVAIEGDADKARVRIKAGNSATGDVVLRCDILAGGRICATATRKVTVFQVPDGTVNGLFSIADGVAVLFASGNLTYQKSTGRYTLQEHQWSAYSGVTSSKKPTDADEDYYDVFIMHEDTKPGSRVVPMSEKVDPFVNRNASPAVHVASRDTYGWYIPTRGQFSYLFNGRTGGILPKIGASTGRYMLATLLDGSVRKDGMIVFPDCFEWPSELTLPTTIGGGNTYCTFDEYTVEQFEQYLEPLGCLFLPGGNAAPGFDELGKENLNTLAKFYSMHLLYYDGTKGYFYFELYSYNIADYAFTTPTPVQNLVLEAYNVDKPNRWFHVRTAKRYDEVYAR